MAPRVKSLTQSVRIRPVLQMILLRVMRFNFDGSIAVGIARRSASLDESLYFMSITVVKCVHSLLQAVVLNRLKG
ncbi:hypothetical protein SAMN06269250_3135 [Spirosoma fluviale]|uniref:Uncharacterized protein n=1 Tax=Spirosoma fluviale TaxID=1597977 RepID=A0A286G260_9BACT|nr:hypothetical protein SAMN06269250_3135 [Spirosoma fluviale]